MKRGSIDTDLYYRRNLDLKGDEEGQIKWRHTIVITRRYFHDDWTKIINALKEINDSVASINPFQADKALIYFNSDEQANLFCKNKGWVAIESFYVKFESWDQEAHSFPKLVPSYGGWLRFRGIPLHAWNINTFKQIGDACGGFEEVGNTTWRKLDLVEARIKVKNNYCGFVPATISISDKERKLYTVHTVTPANGRWIIGRNPKIHGSFTREAASSFEEFDMMAGSYNFRGHCAYPPSEPDNPEAYYSPLSDQSTKFAEDIPKNSSKRYENTRNQAA